MSDGGEATGADDHASIVPPGTDKSGGAQDASETVNRLVSEALGESHGVECVAVRGGAVRVLLKAAREADLLVVDSPRPTKLAKMSTKLVAPQLIHRSQCPVVVMPAAQIEGAGASAGLGRATGRVAAAIATAAASPGRPGLAPFPRAEKSS